MVPAQTLEENYYNPLSSKTGIGIEGGLTYTKSDFSESGLSYIGRVTADYYFTTRSEGIFGLSGIASYGYLTGKGTYANNSQYPTIPEFETQIFLLSGGLSYTLTSFRVIYPYAAARLGYMYFQPMDTDGNELPGSQQNLYSPNSWYANGELGFKIPTSENVSINLAAAMNYVPNDNLDDVSNDVSNGSDKDIFFTLTAGLQFYFGGFKDTDGDGVRDRDDLCPATPPGVIVDQFGCPVDTDRDGVPDYIDECPNTPVNIPVDVNGCPVDADRDGVPDYLDLCKDTPMGVAVDIRGCPLDSDDDGVPDYKDLCPNTPVGTEVNKWGCTIEEKVYEPITKTEFVLSGGINFESNKFDLLAAAYPELDKVLKVMRDYPDTKWKIEGHTDNTGSDKLNRELSINRAKSVYNYFVSNGINANRLSYNGYGPDYPIADNSTETGKALNRRVTIVLVGDKETQPTEVLKPVVNRNYNSAVERNVGKMIFTDGYLFTVQVSSWRSRAKAESEAKRLQDQGYNAFIIIAELPDLDGTWYRVRIGYFNTFEEASKVREKI
jgi:outer membrane protein OmpA-like peptidoglycan-associated protein